MARLALTSEQFEGFRRRAIEAAMQVFVAEGYEGLTMRTLAKALGVSPMTPYRYFEDKDALMLALRVEATRRFADHQADRAPVGMSSPARILALARAHLRFAIEQPEAYRIIFELRPPSPPRNAELEAQHERAFSGLYAATRDAIDEGVLAGDPLTNAHLIWSQTHGLVCLYLAGTLTMGRSVESLCAQLETLARAWMHRCASDIPTSETESTGPSTSCGPRRRPSPTTQGRRPPVSDVEGDVE